MADGSPTLKATTAEFGVVNGGAIQCSFVTKRIVLTVNLFDGWGKERAKAILDAWPGCTMNAAQKGERKGGHLKYGASYSFPGSSRRDLVVNLRGQQRGVEVTINSSSVDGLPYREDDFPTILLQRRVPQGFEGADGNPGIRTSVNRSASLKPKSNELLELYVRDEASFLALVAWYSGRLSTGAVSLAPVLAADPDSDILPTTVKPDQVNPPDPQRQGISPEALAAQDAANAETGRIGELVAIDMERKRLTQLGCLNVHDAVTHVALQRTDAGFDLESRWNGERRCIEVKSSTTDCPDFFLSANERAKLAALGPQAWLYRVTVRPVGSGEVVEMLQDPIAQIPDACFQPVVWRVRRSFLG